MGYFMETAVAYFTATLPLFNDKVNNTIWINEMTSIQAVDMHVSMETDSGLLAIFYKKN